MSIDKAKESGIVPEHPVGGGGQHEKRLTCNQETLYAGRGGGKSSGRAVERLR